PEELIAGPVELVGSGFADRVNNAACGISVFSREAARQHRELLNGVHAEHEAGDVTRCGVGIIHDADTVNAVVVKRLSLSGNGGLATESAVAAGGSRSGH